jgi:WD40 repeat protein
MTFFGHTHISYRCRACFGHGEASFVAGDKNGSIWAWDLLDVSCYSYVCRRRVSGLFLEQAKPLKPNPPSKVHHKVVTWTEHHPEARELITASADGTVKVWRYPAPGSCVFLEKTYIVTTLPSVDRCETRNSDGYDGPKQLRGLTIVTAWLVSQLLLAIER